MFDYEANDEPINNPKDIFFLSLLISGRYFLASKCTTSAIANAHFDIFNQITYSYLR
jgi:hypothetical protein